MSNDQETPEGPDSFSTIEYRIWEGMPNMDSSLNSWTTETANPDIADKSCPSPPKEEINGQFYHSLPVPTENMPVDFMELSKSNQEQLNVPVLTQGLDDRQTLLPFSISESESPKVWDKMDLKLANDDVPSLAVEYTPMTTRRPSAVQQANQSSPQPPSPGIRDPSPPLQQVPPPPPLRLQPPSQLLQPHVSQAMGVTSDTISFPNFPMQKQYVMYTVPQQSVQTSLPTLIMQQPAVPSGSSGVSGGSGSGGGMVDVPILSDSEGEYGFSVSVEEKERTTKSPMFLMSQVTKKLYTNINKAVPFEVHLSKQPPDRDHLHVKAVPVFSSPQFLRTNVSRCPNHAAPSDPTNHDFPYPEYVVRADHPKAQYVQGATGRLAVVVPLDPLQDGPDYYTPVLLRFMCLGSCVGGINRRPIAIILTLENNQGEVLGRKMIDVRVCACPTRDIKTDEQAAKGTKRKGNTGQEKMSMQRKKPKLMEPKFEAEDDDQVFTITVRGAALYKFMLGVKAMYYSSHPEYALRYPEPVQQPPSSVLPHKNKMRVKEMVGMQENMEEVDSGTWESEAGSPSYDLLDEPRTDPLDISGKSSASVSSVGSPMKLVLVESNGIDQRDTMMGNGELKGQTQAELNEFPLVMSSPSKVNMTKSSVASKPAVVLPRHIPVMQVSSYQPTIRRVASEPKMTRIRQSPSHPRILSCSQGQGGKIGIRMSSVKTERDLSPPREGSVSPGSKEMMAANVLSGRFYQDDSFT